MANRENTEKLIESAKTYIGNPESKFNIIMAKDKKTQKMPKSVFVFQVFAENAASRLKPTTTQILWYIVGIMNWENYLSMDIKTLCESLHMSKKSAIVSLSELERFNVVIKKPNPRDKRRNDYFINPMAMWKGFSVERKKKIKEIEDIQGEKLTVFNLTESKNELNEYYEEIIEIENFDKKTIEHIDENTGEITEIEYTEYQESEQCVKPAPPSGAGGGENTSKTPLFDTRKYFQPLLF